MSLRNYGVLKGTIRQRKEAASDHDHYQLLVEARGDLFRVAINVQSKEAPSEVEFFSTTNFLHPITEKLLSLPEGFVRPAVGSPVRLDYLRLELFDRSQLLPLPVLKEGDTNDLNDFLNALIVDAIGKKSDVYAFGDGWGPQSKEDPVFHFSPGRGVHDIHMNQGNSENYTQDDGVFQDGGLILHDKNANTWAAVFIKFQSQSWKTDNRNGHKIDMTDHDLRRKLVSAAT